MFLFFLLVSVAFCAYLIISHRHSRILLQLPYHKFNSRHPFFFERLYTIFILGISNAEERFKIISGLCLQYSDMVKVWFGPQLVLFVNHPKRIQKVLMSPKCADKWNLFYVLMDRENSLTSGRTSMKWKEHRKFFNYCFSLPALQSYVQAFNECSDRLCETLKREKTGIEISFLPIAKQFSFDVFSVTLTNIKAKDVFGELNYDKIFFGFETTEEAFNHKTEIPFLYPNTLFQLTKLRREERKAQQVLDEFRHYIIRHRRTIMEASDSDTDGDGSYNGTYVMIDHIIRNEEKFTNKEILDHVLNFMAGYEILANCVAHTVMLLAMHTDIQQKLFESIQSSIVSDEAARNYAEHVKDIQYLDFVVKECFRLMPTVPMILREVTDDFEIEPSLVIPKGVKIVLNFYALHRRKDIWGNDSDEFKPERFAKDSENRDLYSFLPFSGGTRICIGNKYTIILLKIVIVQLMRQFKFSTSMTMNDIRLKSYVSMKLCTDHLISIEPRQK